MTGSGPSREPEDGRIHQLSMEIIKLRHVTLSCCDDEQTEGKERINSTNHVGHVPPMTRLVMLQAKSNRNNPWNWSDRPRYLGHDIYLSHCSSLFSAHAQCNVLASSSRYHNLVPVIFHLSFSPISFTTSHPLFSVTT